MIIFLIKSAKFFKILLPVLFFIFTFPQNSLAQPITVEGIEQLILEKKPNDYNIAITDNFKLHRMKIIPIGLNLNYNVSNNRFNIYGKVKIVLDTISTAPDTLYTFFGDSVNPGITITNEVIDSVNIGFSTQFKIKSLIFRPKDLTFKYIVTIPDSAKYVIFGDVNVKFDTSSTSTDSLDAVLGTPGNPGLVIKSGSIEKINIDVKTQFKIKKLIFNPQGLTFRYNKTSTKYEMFGDVKIYADSIANTPDSIDAVLGDRTNPGVLITNGKIDKIDASITGDFNLKKLSISPYNLTFRYSSSDISYSIFGDSIKVRFGENDSLIATIGDSTHPGIKIKDGVVKDINFGITTDFKLKSLEIKPDSLNFVWDNGNDFKIFGDSLNVLIESDTIRGGLGNSIKPGIVISEGAVDSVNISVTADFNLKKIKIQPYDIHFEYSKTEALYKIYGDSIDVFIESDTLNATLGKPTNPGMVINDGIIDSININVNGQFHLKKLDMYADSVNIVYLKDSSFYKFNGKVDFIVENDTLNLSLGSDNSQGIIIKDGKLDKVDIAVTTDFRLKKIKFVIDENHKLTIDYDKDSKHFSMYGGTDIIFGPDTTDQDTIKIGMGNAAQPGLIIDDGKLSSINASITGDFNLKKLSISPYNLTFRYSSSDISYSIFGDSLKVKLGESDSLFATIGDSTLPGIKIKDGVVTEINFGITTDFKLKSLDIKPKGLTFYYDSDSSKYKIYGDLTLSLEQDTLNAQLGDSTNAGIEIIGGSLDKINITAKGNFVLKKLDIKTDPLGLSIIWKKEKSGNIFHFFGGVTIVIDGDSLDASFGNKVKPGIIYSDGSITSYNIGITGKLKFGKFDVTSKGLTIQYSNKVYGLSGILEVDDLWAAEIDFGKNSTPGVTLDVSKKPAKFNLVSTKFSLEDIDLGPISIKDFKLDFMDNEVKDALISVELPPGYDVSGEIKFKEVNKSNDIDKVSLSYSFNPPQDEGITIPGTDAIIVHLEGDIENIENPHEFSINGQVGVIVGGPFTIGTIEDASFLYITGDVKITRSEFRLSDSVKIGAYYSKTKKKWEFLQLGDGHLDLDFKWGNLYSLNAGLNLPSGNLKMLEANLNAKISSKGAINALMNAKLIIPEKVPLIGGTTLAKAGAAIDYYKRDPKSFAAGWVDVDLLFKTVEWGGKYTFKTKSIEAIGPSQINKIVTKVEQHKAIVGDNDYRFQYIDFEIDKEKPHFIMIKTKIDRSKKFQLGTDIISLTVLPPSGKKQLKDLVPMYIVYDPIDFSTSKVNVNPTEVIKWAQIYSEMDSIEFFIVAPGYSKNVNAVFPEGKYKIRFSSNKYEDFLKKPEVHKIYNKPLIKSQSFQLYDQGSYVFTDQIGEYLITPNLLYLIDAVVHNSDSAIVNLFSTNSKNENGHHLKTVNFTNGKFSSGAEYFGDYTNFPKYFNKGDSLYLYLTINDGINALTKSNVIPVSTSELKFLGGNIRVKNMSDSAGSGIEIKLKAQDLNDNWIVIDSTFSKSNGDFLFPYSASDYLSIKFEIDNPFGYEIDSGSNYKNNDIINLNPNNGIWVSVLLNKN